MKRNLSQKLKFAFAWLAPRRKWGILSVSALAVLIFAGVILTTTPAAADVLDYVNRAFAWINFAVSRLFLSLALFLLTFVIQIAGYNGYIDSVAVNVGWVMVRDLVNMAFVIFLLVIAFGTILGLEQYEWKKLMVKFVLAAILVNFSRVICGLMIDVAQVFMTTFVNGIAATAGGNLITAFSADKLYKFNPDTNGTEINDTESFIASIAAVMFAGMMMMTMFAIAVMLLARLVVLWVLIVLSPMAFALNVIPKTEKYAQEWWQEFGQNLVAGPILIFFIWLSLVTVGGGDVAKEISANNVVKQDNSQQPKSGISEVMEWENMASFAIAIGMLLVGAKITQQMSPQGGQFVGKAAEFGKKVAMVAAGATTAKWGLKAGKAAGKFALMEIPYGGNFWKAKAKTEWESAKTAMYGKAAGITKESTELNNAAGEKREKAQSLRQLAKTETNDVKKKKYEEAAALAEKEMEDLEARAQEAMAPSRLSKRGKALKAQAAAKKKESEDLRQRAATATTPEAQADLEVQAKVADTEATELRRQQEEETTRGGGGIVGAIVRQRIGYMKQLKKSEGQREIREKLAFKRASGDSGGWIFNRSDGQVKDAYRYEKGMLEVEEMRSSAKDKEYSAIGKSGALGMRRYRDGRFLPGATMAEQIAKHGRGSARMESVSKTIQAATELKIDLAAKAKIDEVDVAKAALDVGLQTTAEKELLAKKAQAEEDAKTAQERIEAEFAPAITAAQVAINDPKAEFNKDVAKAEDDLVDYRKNKKVNDILTTDEQTRQANLDKEAADLQTVIQNSELAMQEAFKKYQEERRGITDADALKTADEKFKTDHGKRQKEVNDKKNELEQLGSRRNKTAAEEKLEKNLEDAKTAREAKGAENGYDTVKKALVDKETEKQEKFEKARTGIVAAQKAIDAYTKKDPTTKKSIQDTDREAEFKADPTTGSKDFATREAEVKARKAALEASLNTVPGAGDFMAAERATAMEEHAHAGKLSMQGAAWGLKAMHDVLTAIDLGEQGKKAGEEFIKTIKDNHLANSFKAARKEIDAVIDNWKKAGTGQIKFLDEEVRRLSARNAFVAALNYSEKSKITAKDKNMREAQAADVASNAVVNIRKGRELPSEAIDALYEAEAKELSGMERADASAAAADTMFYLMAQKEAGHELSADEKSSIMGAWTKVDSESWNDDFADYFIRMVGRHESGDKTLTGQKKAIAEQMAKFAKDANLKFENEVVNGVETGRKKFAGAYNREMSSMWQTLAATGGDTKLWNAHNAINQEEKEMGSTKFDSSGGYWGAAERLAARGQLGGYSSVAEMEAAYGQNQDGLKFAARKFKANGIGNGHWESVLNQEFDDRKGIYRINTLNTAQGGSITEMGKRTLNELLKFQNHSAGDFDLTTGLMRSIDSNLFGALTAQMKTENDVKFMNFRSIIKLLGGHESETELRTSRGGKDGADTYYHLGGEKMLGTFIDRFGDTMEARDKMDEHLLENFMVKELLGNKSATMLLLQRTMKLNDDDTAHGNFRIKFDGSIGEVQGIEELVKKVEALKAQGRLTSVTPAMLKQLQDMLPDFKSGVIAQSGDRGGKKDKSDSTDFGG
ncbi:MAG: hypothetical protein A3J93_03665 [Candidatus Magasanikbacteria bacterium RIFOXYC2_FULL_42_28]|uniref:Uncharacterized protein n=1 Tax=Candidatus Magasanikbacteria bacterium RIFOXYC2_FULL_42_28 TaxID=1798704 RepID=A0A1F6NUJ9_9BACT|nr:MAG: hypothetical protein A3J93_03665 [Candidatus Magasanikbacteria bacterium RIFOXYC2_FULL_42_28]